MRGSVFLFEEHRSLMIKRLSHVGIVVEDIDESLKQYERLFNLKPTAVVEGLGGKVRAAFIPVGDGEIELLQPTDANVPLMDYLREHGSGIHHISLATDDIEAEVDRLRKEGVVFDRDRPTVGAHGTKISFTVPKSTNGITIELIEDSRYKSEQTRYQSPKDKQ
jgi:methylmalonyl-CoA/ethylmalonyl-CoA epimerase